MHKRILLATLRAAAVAVCLVAAAVIVVVSPDLADDVAYRMRIGWRRVVSEHVIRDAHATLSTTNSTISYTSNGVTVAFTVPYKFLNSSHLVVQKIVSSVTTTLVLGTDYSVTGAGSSSGGTVTLNVAVANGGTVKISRSTPKRQDTSLRTFPISTSGKTVEDALDYRTMVEQEMNDGTFTQLLATPVTTAQATTAAPSTVPNSSNTNTAGSSSAFPRADHVHQCTAASGTQTGCITTGSQTIAGVKTFSSDPVFSSGSVVVTTGVQSFSGAKTFSSAAAFSSGATIVGGAIIGSSGTAISGSFRGTATWNPGTLGACGAGPCVTATTNITVTGAATGADCVAGVVSPAPLSGYPVQCIVTSTNTCGLMIVNQSNVGVTFGSATFYCRVFNP